MFDLPTRRNQNQKILSHDWFWHVANQWVTRIFWFWSLVVRKSTTLSCDAPRQMAEHHEYLSSFSSYHCSQTVRVLLSTVWVLLRTEKCFLLCVECNAGYEPTGTSPLVCRQCPQGTYKGAAGNVACTACTGSFTTQNLGSTDISQCGTCVGVTWYVWVTWYV